MLPFSIVICIILHLVSDLLVPGIVRNILPSKSHRLLRKPSPHLGKMSGNYYCIVCDRYFVSQASLDQHRRASWRHKSYYTCPDCNDRRFGSWESLQQHWRMSTAHSGDHCSTCDHYFPNFVAKRWHQKETYPEWCRIPGCRAKFDT